MAFLMLWCCRNHQLSEVIVILNKKIITKRSPEYKQAKQLYFDSFPKDERVPWSWLMLRSKKQFIEFIGFYDDEKLVGFAYNITQGDLTYLFYLAVDPNLRGGGYGSQILQDVIKMYSGQRICLSAEILDPDADNALQREKRIAFYQRNGFKMSDKIAKEAGVVYSMLTHGGDFEKQEYIDIQNYFNGIFSLFVKIYYLDPK